ncbi:MAG: hypothetical protein FP826_04335 [Sphingomonadales bacterium]|nr:hypothetical protein [Sphingomonadales bacterium]MBU3991346.1 hypothetical protein [Alphaproteobacteria bacterium]
MRPYAVAQDYGTLHALRALVVQAHVLRMMMFLDVDLNHFGPDGNRLGAYAADFCDDRARSSWGGKIAAGRAAVRRHNVSHVLLTGENGAYHADFAEDSTAKPATCRAECRNARGSGIAVLGKAGAAPANYCAWRVR